MGRDGEGSPGLRVGRDGGIVRVVLDRAAKRNAQTLEMWEALRRVGAELAADPSVRVVVVSGEGTVFSAGIDLGLLAAQAAGTGPPLPAVELVQQAFTWLRDGHFVSIAAVQGAAIGAGMQLALACDLRILAEGTVMALPEIEFGIFPDLGGCAWLPELVGTSRAKELILTGRKIGAAEALQLGLANEVVAAADLARTVDTVAARLAERAPLAVRAVKRAVAGSVTSPETALRISAEEIRRCLGSEEFRSRAGGDEERRGGLGNSR
jgi:enoyl-CoA hydratase/carnithine racemase